MSLIKKSNELVIPTTVKMMIYGQAGMAKRSMIPIPTLGTGWMLSRAAQ